MRRLLLIGLLVLSACSVDSSETAPPNSSLPSCFEENTSSAQNPIVLSLGESVKQLSGERWFGVEVGAGRYELLLDNIPPYDALGTTFYQAGKPYPPIEATLQKTYLPTLRIPVEAEAGGLVIRVTHIIPFSEMTCDTYTLTVRALP